MSSDKILKPSFLNLPNEIIIYILGFVFHHEATTNASACAQQHFAGVLRVNRLIYRLGQDIVHRNIRVSVPGLCRLQSIIDKGLQPRDAMCKNTQSLDVALDYFSSPINSFKMFTTTTGIPFLQCDYRLHPSSNCSYDRCDSTGEAMQRQTAYIRLDSWITLLNASLKSFSAHWPSFQRLTSLAIRAQTSADIFTRARRSVKPFLNEDTLIECLKHVAHCKNLRSLVIDTADADTSRWSLDLGIGPTCSTHVCEMIRDSVSKLPRLQHLHIRRRDMCPRALAFGPSDAVLQSLESIVIDLRLVETQRTGLESWSAHTRHCGCCCWCSHCLRRWHGSNLERDEGILHQSTERQRDLVVVMSEKLAEIANMMDASKGHTLEVRAYECPETDMMSRARRPVVVDCAAGRRHSSRNLI